MDHDEKNNQDGLITVEAILSLVPFIIAILGIISFINIYMVHNKVQYALHQMGAELSGYTYFYEALGLRSANTQFDNDVHENTQNITTAMDQLDEFMTQVGEFEDSYHEVKNGDVTALENVYTNGQNVYESGKNLPGTGSKFIRDPKMLLRELIYFAAGKGVDSFKTFLVGTAAKPLMNAYLDESFADFGGATADEYLRRFGVKNGIDGMSFDNSTMFTAEDNHRTIDIVVEYKIEIYILKLFFKDPTITVVQRCVIPAWLDGDGVKYSK